MYMQEEAYLFCSIFNFMENNAVRLIHFDLLAVHDKQPLFQIHGEEGHRIGFMVQGYQMPVIGEKIPSACRADLEGNPVWSLLVQCPWSPG